MSVALLTEALGGIAVPEADCLTADMHRGLTFSRELSGHAYFLAGPRNLKITF